MNWHTTKISFRNINYSGKFIFEFLKTDENFLFVHLSLSMFLMFWLAARPGSGNFRVYKLTVKPGDFLLSLVYPRQPHATSLLCPGADLLHPASLPNLLKFCCCALLFSHNWFKPIWMAAIKSERYMENFGIKCLKSEGKKHKRVFSEATLGMHVRLLLIKKVY